MSVALIDKAQRFYQAGRIVRPEATSRLVRLSTLVIVGSELSAFVQVSPPRAEPFVPVGVTYAAWPTNERTRAVSDLQSIRAEGFNAIGARVNWTDPGSRLDALDTLLDLAADADLKVVVQID